MTTPSDAAVAKLRESLGILAELILDWAEWDARSRAWSTRGYPTSTRAGGGGRSTTATSPTETAALTPDLITGQRLEQYARVSELLDLLVTMDRQRLAVMKLSPPAPDERGVARCANAHGCPDDAHAAKAGRCLRCYDYQYRTGRDRTPRVA